MLVCELRNCDPVEPRVQHRKHDPVRYDVQSGEGHLDSASCKADALRAPVTETEVINVTDRILSHLSPGVVDEMNPKIDDVVSTRSHSTAVTIIAGRPPWCVVHTLLDALVGIGAFALPFSRTRRCTRTSPHRSIGLKSFLQHEVSSISFLLFD